MESPFIGFVSTVNHHCGKKALYEVAFELAPTRLFLGERKKGRGGDSSIGIAIAIAIAIALIVQFDFEIECEFSRS